MGLPVLAVKLRNGQTLNRAGIKAAHVNTVTIRIRPRNVERFDTADFTKPVLRHAGVERVRREGLFALKQAES